jgi:thioredoxin-related protein
MTVKMKRKLTRIYKGKEILCSSCKTKEFRTIGNKKKYGVIVVHKNRCPYLNELQKINQRKNKNG